MLRSEARGANSTSLWLLYSSLPEWIGKKQLDFLFTIVFPKNMKSMNSRSELKEAGPGCFNYQGPNPVSIGTLPYLAPTVPALHPLPAWGMAPGLPPGASETMQLGGLTHSPEAELTGPICDSTSRGEMMPLDLPRTSMKAPSRTKSSISGSVRELPC